MKENMSWKQNRFSKKTGHKSLCIIYQNLSILGFKTQAQIVSLCHGTHTTIHVLMVVSGTLCYEFES